MAKYLRHYDEFLSRDNHIVRVEILQEADAPFVPEELDANESLTIEWAETDKITPIQGSTATLVINCATDRQFIDLGTIVSADAVRLDIYRDGSLYWSGCMDSEIYDEPYSSGKNYAVTLIFSDFGVLNRVKWSRTSLESFNTILDAALAASGINYTNLIRNISTTDSYSMALDFDNDVKLLNENFYNEEGEPMTAFEVLEGILQPFALRIIQRAGNIYIYDLNSLYSQDSTEIEWTDTDAHFSKDMVYNDATVRFSPYADDQAVDGNVKVKRVDGNGLMIKTSYEGAVDRVLDGFILRRGSYVTAEGLTLEPGVEYFDIDAQYSGSDAQGVLWGYKQGERALEDGNIVQVLNAPCSAVDANLSFIGTKMFTTQCKWLNEVSVVNGVRDKFKLRINLDFLFDVRYNPFEEAGDYNEKDNFKLMSKCRFVYVPVMVTLRDANGTALYHLDNRSLIASSNLQSSSGRTRWQPGEGTPGCFWLAYYDYKDRKGKTGVGGWARNKKAIGQSYDEIPETWQQMQDGEYVELPMVGGYLEMAVYSGAYICGKNGQYTDILQYIRWVAYKDASITLVRKNGLPVEMEDQEDIAHINDLAFEKRSVETIIGTLSPKVQSVTGRGLIFSALSIHEKFTRAGVQDRLEKLLLGTIYSQYAQRYTKLSGMVTLLSGFGTYTDAHSEGKYIIISDMQDLHADESNVCIVEFGQDNYEGIDYE
jgi:hypothetical protein